MWLFFFLQQLQLALESLDRRLVLYSARSVPDCLWIFRILVSVRTIRSGSAHGILVSFFLLICLFVISSFRWVLFHKQPKKWPVQMGRSSLTESPTHISGFFCRKTFLCVNIFAQKCVNRKFAKIKFNDSRISVFFTMKSDIRIYFKQI